MQSRMRDQDCVQHLYMSQFQSCKVAVLALKRLRCRTPEAMLKMIDLVLESFDRSWGPGSMLGKASTIVNPTVVTRMRELQTAIRKDFM